ncbi:urea-proton symporter DUR3 [Iris pallida]|uniref:Urea-proton symporter DUR3 n=1 Tax=Iris pallida TaxID=29817 RepID=A0AAX6HZK3_IRIPA|nr:urea-proton symporter DUR3 [Iris pallida]
MATSSSSSVCPPLGFASKYYSVSPEGECTRQSSFFQGKAVLNQGVGYSVILGFGAFFAVFTSFLVWLEKRYVGSRHTSEWFNTAGRNVKTGLIASVIVSQWTWAATILQSSNVAWEYGISGPFWYASGATIQVLLFGVMAIEIKRKAPEAHTVCEIVRARWGTAAHVVFLIFCFMTNIIVTAMLLLGGSAVVNALTGVNIYAASFLIPLGVVVYTLAGGLKATFLASYIHSVIVHIVLVIFVYLVYTASDKLGSPRVVYNHLLEVASKTRVCQDPISHIGQACGPVSGNHKGSYLTMLSSGGFVFGIINIVGNFGTVFVDNGYWVSAIAARPSSTHKGYLLGGLVWFAVPFSLATSLGLGALALDLPITASEASRGLVPPATAIALMGKAGSVLLLTMLFMKIQFGVLHILGCCCHTVGNHRIGCDHRPALSRELGDDHQRLHGHVHQRQARRKDRRDERQTACNNLGNAGGRAGLPAGEGEGEEARSSQREGVLICRPRVVLLKTDPNKRFVSV